MTRSKGNFGSQCAGRVRECKGAAPAAVLVLGGRKGAKLDGRALKVAVSWFGGVGCSCDFMTAPITLRIAGQIATRRMTDFAHRLPANLAYRMANGERRGCGGPPRRARVVAGRYGRIIPCATAKRVRPATVWMSSLRMMCSRWVCTVRTPTDRKSVVEGK